MKKIMLLFMIILISGCSTYPIKRTSFYKDGKLVKSFVGKGVFDGEEWYGIYKVWAPDGWRYFEYRCPECTVEEQVLSKR